VWSGCAAVILAAVPWIVRQPELKPVVIVIGGFAAIFSAYTLMLGPQLARQDLRSDLSHSDILKTYPLAGWQIVLGGLLTPAAILTGLLWLALLAVVCALDPLAMQLSWFTASVRLSAALGIALIIPPLCVLQLLVPNAAALVFPAWFQATRQRGGGIDLMGQRVIFGLGQLLTMVLALLPAVLTAGALIFITQWIIGLPAAVAVATLTVIVILLGEIWCGLWWLGERFEKLDLSSELRP
jgi:hypothetical protein